MKLKPLLNGHGRDLTHFFFVVVKICGSPQSVTPLNANALRNNNQYIIRLETILKSFDLP